jgi:hypothetical protein
VNTDLDRAEWRKSSLSGGSGGNCVEVATNLPGIIAVRDSKDLGGPALLFTLAQWRTFLAASRSGRSEHLSH